MKDALVTDALYAVGFRYGATLVVHGKTSVGAVFNVLMAVLLGSLALGSVAPLMTAFGAARAAAGQLYATIEAGSALDTLTPVSEAPVVEKAKAILGCVEFRDVHFAYPARPDISVLKGMSFIAQPGQTVALVGPSGSGKVRACPQTLSITTLTIVRSQSTVAQLVERFYEPTVGSITLDDTPLDSYNVQSIRAAIGFVQQEAVLFDMTIADNIRMGLEAAAFLEGRFAGADVPMEQVVEAAKVANAHDFISRLPEGYETRVGQRGAQLSGGMEYEHVMSEFS
jgi:ATP-binding cassette subfamily B (MDR/TAP) protein 1